MKLLLSRSLGAGRGSLISATVCRSACARLAGMGGLTMDELEYSDDRVVSSVACEWGTDE